MFDPHPPIPFSGRAPRCSGAGIHTDRLAAVTGYHIPARCKMGFTYRDVHHGEIVFSPAVPSLRLYGRWLETCGFRIGDEIGITTGHGLLLLCRREAP
ncbi:MAG TPA: SymE family type I addiction module toxin [Stenotrophomonas sp.]|nr:SymE family type I addiction module toxin [Stenotrophomonas sp.]